jgi:hypothetical protein
MSSTRKLASLQFASIAAMLLVCLTSVNAQEAEKTKKQSGPAHRAADADEQYVLRTYDVADIVINVQDHPYSESLQRDARPAPPRGGGGGFGGGGGGGVFSVPDNRTSSTNRRSKTASGAAPLVMLCQFGPEGGRGSAPGGTLQLEGTGSTGPAITMGDLIRVITNTIASETWSQPQGEGKIQSLGTSLIVWQTPSVHKLIQQLFQAVSQTSGHRQTLTVDARWLLLSFDDVDSLVMKDSKELPQVNRDVLAKFSRRSSSIRGLTNCFSGQLVYVVSGTQRSFVVGYIPVVGALERQKRDTALVSLHEKPRFQLVADSSEGGFSRSRSVGYQPIVENENFGAVLEIRPTSMGGLKSDVIVELKSTLTAQAEHAAESPRAATSDGMVPAVDRVAVESQEFATTLRVPFGKPILVGGMTHLAGPAKANEDAKSPERPQLYLVLEIR